MSRFGEGGGPPEEFRMSPPDNREGAAPEALPTVDESELEISFARSSGPGGQNVNKTETKAVLHWSLGKAKGFSEEQKDAIRAFAGEKRLAGDDRIYLYDQTSRSQVQNRKNVIERLHALVADALTPEKERKATKVPRGSKESRLRDKGRQAEKKERRKVDRNDW